MSGKRFALLLVVTLFGAAAAACGDNSRAESLEKTHSVVAVELPAVSVVTIGTGDLTASLAISGSVSPRSRVAVIPKMSGTLQRVAVDIGDRVSPGQLVAVQDRRELDAQTDAAEAAVAVARAGLEQAEAALANAKLEFDRSTNLFQKGALARQRLDASETALRSATAARSLSAATLQQAEASLRRAKEVRRDATLTAPTAGVVVERNFDQGALVGPGDSKGVVVVADVSEMKLEAGVSELEAGRLQVGMPAVVSIQARPGHSWHGRVVAVAPEVDTRNRHFRVEVRVQNPNGELLSGMYATARIETGRAAGATLVLRDAVATRNGVRVAYRVVDGVVSAVPVTEGLSDESRVEILSGLDAGDQIVADARKPMASGTKVRAIPLAADAAAADAAR
jgi:membrane fusion protein (multidrug efflux system)